MELSELIRANLDRLVDEWAAYASRHIQVTEGLTDKEIRNSSRTLFAVIADDMDIAQSSREQFEKSQGQRPDDSKPIFEHATEHANARVAQGFSLPDLASEFRAARASVMRLLDDADLRRGIRLSEVERFNEALDEVQAVSIRRFDQQLNQARDMFLGVLGHDLRNPLSAILNGVKVLLRDESLSPASAKVSARIYSSSKRIHSMIDDLLDFTRTKLGKGLPVTLTMGDMGETVGQVVEELRDRNPAARIQYEASGELHGRWDFARFAQVVSNLGGNAIQHGDNAHPVSVRLQGEEDRIVLTVRNQGPPIGPSALHRIFDPLTRGSESEPPEHKGSLGLGLYICRQIALAHGGTIGVASDGNGTTFEVGIPRQAEPRRRATDV